MAAVSGPAAIRTPGQPKIRAPMRAVDANQEARSGALDGAAQALGAQAGIGDHNHRTQAQAGVDQRGQFDPRGHQQVDPVAGAHPDAGNPAASSSTRLAKWAQSGAGRVDVQGHVDDGGWVVAPGVQLGEHGTVARPRGR